jgi:hypothetical protein
MHLTVAAHREMLTSRFNKLERASDVGALNPNDWRTA